MVPGNLGRAPGIGKRWPYKSLNYLPSKQLWKFLTWKSGGSLSGLPFDLGKSLTDCRRILVVLPAGFQENLVAFPVAQSLIEDLSGTEFLMLAEQGLSGFVSALFGPERILGLRPEEFHWGEGHFQDLMRTISAFRPDITLNFRTESPPLLHYLLRASLAPVRVLISDEDIVPFANILLRPSQPPNHLRRFMLASGLWNVSGRPIASKWSRLRPSPENLKEAGSLIASKGLRPDKTRLFLWQDNPPFRQRELLQAAVAERSAEGESKSLLVLNGAGSLHATPTPPQDLILGLPGLEVDSTGLLLGLFAQTALSIGMNGPLLHLASLADTDVMGFFEDADAAWDTSFLNPRLRIAYAKHPETKA